MSRLLFLVTTLALFVHKGKAADCSGTAYPKTCELWSALQDNFGGASWTQCGSNAVNSRYVNPCGNAKCPVQNGLLTCNGNSQITSFNFNSENNLVAEADISSFVSMLETYRVSYNFQTLTLQNQASLGLDECLEPCADGLTCDFTGSECTGSCTTDGICVTDAPTPAPSAPTPAPTSAPTYNTACSGTAYPKTCELWSALQDNFGGASWTQCGSNAVNSRYVNPCGNAKCPVQNGLLTCNGNSQITSFNFNSENNLVAEADISSFVSMLETYRVSYNFQTLTLQNQASLGLDECLEPCADGLTCDFTGSECTGSCTTDGICVTDAPTPAPSAPTPAPTSAPTYNTACSGTAYPKTCELWSALQDNFGGASWTQCGSNAVNSRYVNPCGNAKCPVQNGLVTCNGNGEITSFNFNSENNLVAEADISSFVSMLETYKASYNFQTLTLQNQASLGLDECLEPCADGLTCDFTGSECTGSCTTDGICVTDAPTPAPSAPTPAPTSAPTRNADCSTTAYPKACELWSALQDNFGGASWTQCGINAVNSRYINPCSSAKCPVQNGLLTCNSNNEITSFNFNSENNLIAEADISSFVSMLETYRDSYNFQTLTLQNQASLGLDECLEPCADGLTCDFTGSECTGSCTTDGICVTDAPTPAPTFSPTSKAACSGTTNPQACKLWVALQDNFGGARWTRCGITTNNARYINPCGSAKCPLQNGLVMCNSKGEITSFNFNSENNLVAEADISSFVSMLETYRDSYNFQTLTLQNQASLGLDECLEPCADGLTCDFTGSECTGSCTTDGICVTDAPTPAPTPLRTARPAKKPKESVRCGRFNTRFVRQKCNLWNSLMDAFTSDDWKVCQSSRNEDPCSAGACAQQEGFVGWICMYWCMHKRWTMCTLT